MRLGGGGWEGGGERPPLRASERLAKPRRLEGRWEDAGTPPPPLARRTVASRENPTEVPSTPIGHRTMAR